MELFAKLDKEMLESGIEAEVFVVGGAAMALTLDNERVTTDIDGHYENLSLDSIVRKVAVQEGLPTNWLNHSVNTTLSYFKKDTGPLTVFNGRALTIQTASPKFILAMKLAARREKDIDDILVLVCELDLKSKAEIVAVVDEYFNADLSATAWQRRQIEEFLDLIAEEGRLEL
jgi:hypothetical protein